MSTPEKPTAPVTAPRQAAATITTPIARLGALILACLVLAAVGVFPQLSARFGGKEYELRVAPYDPIDPFRGAYVALTYPDLHLNDPNQPLPDGATGDFFLPLTREGEVWAGGTPTHDRPDHGPYLACSANSFPVSCGIESWFLPQGKAAELGKAVSAGTAVAVVRIDSRGNAALVEVKAG